MDKIESVLLIDDSNAVNNRNKSLLDSMNIFDEINKFSDPNEALEFLKKDNNKLPDLIFLDINMPEMDAFSFLNKYIEIENVITSNYKPIIVIVSDYLLENQNLDKTNRYKSIGVVDHLKKPFDKQDVLLILEEHIENFES